MNLLDKILNLIAEQKSEEDIQLYLNKALINCSITEVKSLLKNPNISAYINLDLFSFCIDKIAESKHVREYFSIIEQHVTELSCRESMEDLSYFVVSLIIDAHNGYKRIIGRHLWDFLNLNNSDLNLLSMNEEFQMRFVLSILQDLGDPKKRLAKSVLFFNSKHSSVRKVLFHTLANYAFNYFGAVKKVLSKSKINKSNEYSQFTDLLKQLDSRFEYMDKCKELNSCYSMPTAYDLCNRTIQTHMKDSLKEAEKKHDSFIYKCMSKVALGKGGGWRDKCGRVQQLAHIKFSREMPIMVSSMSPLENKEFLNNLLLDWTSVNNKNEE